jgi:hypothetical protein
MLAQHIKIMHKKAKQKKITTLSQGTTPNLPLGQDHAMHPKVKPCTNKVRESIPEEHWYHDPI